MTTHYAQEVLRRARQDVADVGRIKADTYTALLNIGYSSVHIDHLERRLQDNAIDAGDASHG